MRTSDSKRYRMIFTAVVLGLVGVGCGASDETVSDRTEFTFAPTADTEAQFSSEATGATTAATAASSARNLRAGPDTTTRPESEYHHFRC